MTTTARWIRDVIAHLGRGRHVLLHGNVRDLAMYEGVPLAFSDALDAALEEAGYGLRARWNQADGLQFAEPAMRGRWQELERDQEVDAAPRGRAYMVPPRPGVPSRPSRSPHRWSSTSQIACSPSNSRPTSVLFSCPSNS